MNIDMSNYKMIYKDQVFNVVAIYTIILNNQDGTDKKVQFIEASYIDEDGELKIVQDEGWCFKFVRR